MNKIVFVTNALGSDDWVQIYLGDMLTWDGQGRSESIESFADALRDGGFDVEIEYVTDEEMAEYAE